MVKAANGKSGYENLWYNFDQRNLTAVNSEMLLSLAQYGSETNSKFQIYAHPGSRGGTFGSRKPIISLLTRKILVEMSIVLLTVFIS